MIKQLTDVFFVFDSILGRYKTRSMCFRVVSEAPFLTVYSLDKYKTQAICDEAVDDSLVALKLFRDWFVTGKMIEKLMLLSTQMKIHFILMKILVMTHFLAMNWVFLI